MTTVTKSFDQKVEKTERRITNRYTQGDYRVKVTTTFYGTRKSYISRVSECKIQTTDNPNIVFEVATLNIGFSGMGNGDYSERILEEKTTRYNFKTLEQVHAQAVELASGTVGTLLQKGKTNTQIEEDA
jgi:hypothetical protein